MENKTPTAATMGAWGALVGVLVLFLTADVRFVHRQNGLEVENMEVDAFSSRMGSLRSGCVRAASTLSAELKAVMKMA